MLLFLSAALRLGAQVPPTEGEAPLSTENLTAQADLPSADLLAAFQAREARLAAREEQLQERINTLREAELRIADQLAALDSAEQGLAALIAQVETASGNDLGLLRAVYENMKPKDAAALFAEMTPEFAAGFLGMMRPEASALIMTELPPDVAYAFSVVLAGRNANAALP